MQNDRGTRERKLSLLFSAASFIFGILISKVFDTAYSKINVHGWSEFVTYQLAIYLPAIILTLVAGFLFVKMYIYYYDLYLLMLGYAGGTFRYIDDPVDEFDNSSYSGNVYKSIVSYVNQADSSIYALTMSATTDANAKFRDGVGFDERSKYFQSLEKVIKERTRNFVYERIIQHGDFSKKRIADTDVLACMDDVMRNHLKNACISRDIGKFDLELSITRINTQRLTGFLIIDDRILIVLNGGIDKDGRPYHAGAFICERSVPNDDLISAYKKRFTRFKERAVQFDYETVKNYSVSDHSSNAE